MRPAVGRVAKCLEKVDSVWRRELAQADRAVQFEVALSKPPLQRPPDASPLNLDVARRQRVQFSAERVALVALGASVIGSASR